MKNLRFLLSLSGCLLALFAASDAGAIPLSTLLAGGSITANDKLFDDWTLISQGSSEAGRTVNTSNIDVTGLTDGGSNPGPGLQFNVSNNELQVSGNGVYAYLDFQIGFRVSMAVPGASITDNSLNMALPSLTYTADGNNDLGVSIGENVGTATGLGNLGVKEVNANVLDDVQSANLSDSAAFAPQTQIYVSKDILVWAQDIGDSANLMQFTQRFSEIEIPLPEPTSLSLFSLGMLGLLARRRRA